MNIVDKIRLRAHLGVSNSSDAAELLKEIDRLTGEDPAQAHARVQAAAQIETEQNIAYVLERQLTQGGPLLERLRAALARVDATIAAREAAAAATPTLPPATPAKPDNEEEK